MWLRRRESSSHLLFIIEKTKLVRYRVIAKSAEGVTAHKAIDG
jgi:hypothetical protein